MYYLLVRIRGGCGRSATVVGEAGSMGDVQRRRQELSQVLRLDISDKDNRHDEREGLTVLRGEDEAFED